MLSTVEKVLYLRSIELFSQIRGEDLAELASITVEESREDAEEIFAEGEPGDALYLVVNGRVRVHQSDKPVTELGIRECFGEMAILDAEPRSATVTALGDAQLLKITRDEFHEIMTDKPEIALGVIRVLTRRLRTLPR